MRMKNACVLNDTVHKKYNLSSKPKSFIVALLFCFAMVSHNRKYLFVYYKREEGANISQYEMYGFKWLHLLLNYDH